MISLFVFVCVGGGSFFSYCLGFCIFVRRLFYLTYLVRPLVKPCDHTHRDRKPNATLRAALAVSQGIGQVIRSANCAVSSAKVLDVEVTPSTGRFRMVRRHLAEAEEIVASRT